MTEHNNPPDQITVSRELLRQVLDELDGQEATQSGWGAYHKLREALEHPVQEPVQEWTCVGGHLYNTAPQAQQPSPPADVPMLTEEEIKDAIRHLYQDETALQMSLDITLHEFRAIEQAVHQKAGVLR